MTGVPDGPGTPEEEAAAYLMYAERWHWTPDQVDALPAWIDAQLPRLVAEYDAVQAANQRAASGG